MILFCLIVLNVVKWLNSVNRLGKNSSNIVVALDDLKCFVLIYYSALG